ncbi:MAG TPA: hypothetical protein VNL16_05070 [Chloroflexota bacterium]|nr:hypothetical protein [Chloroflexota bacterium]
MSRFRSWTSLLFIVLGAIIVARGVLEAAPLTFTLMGVVMVALGVYRWRTLRAGTAGRR